MKKRLINFLAFGCLGVTTEVFFTAIGDLFTGGPLGNTAWALKGASYIWMFPIYGLAAFFFPPFWEKIKGFGLVVRLLTYMIVIFTVEFVAGSLLELITGRCPWEYTSGLHIMGYIRLDYAPLWMGYGFVLETVYRWLAGKKTSPETEA